MNEYDCCDGCGESSPYCTNCHTCGDCVNEALESQAKRIASLEAQFKEREWISVEDGLPEAEGMYWCYVPTEKYINQSVYCYSPHSGFQYGAVTHWQPLPEAPQ